MSQTVFINPNRTYSTINKNLYGHFVEHLGRGIYNGLYVGENSQIPHKRGIRTDVVRALRNIRVPVIRWPGGCFAEYYQWRDGVGPRPQRKHIVNASWGGVVEDNAFGTHEFMDLCEQIGCAAYIAGNVGSGTPRETSEWVEYMTFGGSSPMADWRRNNDREKPWTIPFFGIGNENWACGGNMRAAYYADVYRQFATFIRQYGEVPIQKIACGPNGADYAWTDTLMQIAGEQMDGLSLHYYTMPEYYDTEEYPWEKKGSATDFDVGNYYRTLRRALYIEELIIRHKHVMDRHDPQGKVALVIDEWGAWHQPEPETNPAFLFQQNTMRDAMVAAVSLNIFNQHSDRVRMANLAQMVNVLQSVVLTEGAEMVLTPTYHVFDLYKGHQDATLIESYAQQDLIGPQEAQVPLLHISASKDAQGVVHATLANLSLSETGAIDCIIAGGKHTVTSIRYISGDIHACNYFGQAPQVAIQSMSIPPVNDNRFSLTLPPCSVAEIVLQ